MEDTIVVNDFSWSLMIFQIIGVIILVSIIYFVIKFYRKLSRYFDMRIKEMEHKNKTES